MSDHGARVFSIDKLIKHPNADSLSIVYPFGEGGYTVVVRSQDWGVGDLAIYIQPDSLVPLNREEFDWLRNDGRTPILNDGVEHHLVRVKKLRGTWSFGLLIKAPAGSFIGADLADALGIIHYEPPAKAVKNNGKSGGKVMPALSEPKPSCNPPVYDLENLRKNVGVFGDGELVQITEKIHGANARFVAEDRGWFSFSRNGWWRIALRLGNRVFSWQRTKGFKSIKLDSYYRFMRVGSRTQWKRPDPSDTWWRALQSCPQISTFCESHPGRVLYGEVYGDVQDLDYGVPVGEVRFVAFDILDTDSGEWLEPREFRAICNRYNIPMVPLMYNGPFSIEQALSLAEGKAVLGGDHVREGCVVKALSGRKVFKVVGAGYYAR